MNILVTGAKGMIGSQLVKGLLEAGHSVVGVDQAGGEIYDDNYRCYKVDLADKDRLQTIANANGIDRIIHLAALAHKTGEADLSWERYKAINVDCSKNVFEVAGDRPTLFISTVDVFGFYDGKEPLGGQSPIRPVSNYGKSKAMAEEECKKLPHYTIFRLSPVYTNEIKRDIQKRYYLKYPNIAYRVGKGSLYEVLNIKHGIIAMVDWCNGETNNNIMIIKDSELMWTPDCIKMEKEEGRAKIVLWIPRWIANTTYYFLKTIFGENEKIYLLNKVVHPLKTV